jgi:hypothetical protein
MCVTTPGWILVGQIACSKCVTTLGWILVGQIACTMCVTTLGWILVGQIACSKCVTTLGWILRPRPNDQRRLTELTSSMEHIPAGEVVSSSASHIPHIFLEPEGSLPCSQKPVNYPCSEPEQNPVHVLPTYFLKVHFNIIVPFKLWFFQTVSLTEVSQTKLCMHFSPV